MSLFRRLFFALAFSLLSCAALATGESGESDEIKKTDGTAAETEARGAKGRYADGTDAEIFFDAITLRVGAATLRAEVASLSAQRARGLSGREFLDSDSGMLFIFPKPREVCFWMRNTLIPLDLAFLSAGGQIMQTLSLIPHDQTSRCSERPARYGLELNPGWLEESGAKPGDVIPNLPK